MLQLLIFPIEIFNLISYYLDPHKLSVSKSLHKLYNDNWYHSVLKINYPELNLYTKSNYKDLYKKSLLQGDIYHVDFSGKIDKIEKEGYICSSYYGNDNGQTRYNVVLTFNGDLILTNNKKIIKIDYDVDHIYGNKYIKKDKLYKFYDREENNNTYIDSKLKFVHSEFINSAIVDHDMGGWYFITDYTCFTFTDGNIIERSFTDKIKQIKLYMEISYYYFKLVF